MANEQKKYASLANLQTFKTNTDNLYATRTEVEDLSSRVAYINVEDNENVGDVNLGYALLTSDVTQVTGNSTTKVMSQAATTSALNLINDALEQKSQVQVVSGDSSDVLPTLIIHKLTQEEYDQKVANGEIDANAIYLTPDEEIDLSNYATIEELESKADSEHNHDDLYYTESEVDTLLSSKSDSTHNHDSAYDSKGSADNALASAKDYTDSAVSGLADASHTHDDRYYSETEIDAKIDEINGTINSKVDSSVLSNYSTTNESKNYTDNAVATKTQVQMIIWEDDD